MKKTLSYVVPIVGLGIVLCTAYGLDNWITSIKRESFQNFTGTLTWLLPANLSLLFVAFLLLTLLWLIYYKKFNNRVVAVIYTLVGLGAVFYLSIVISLANRLALPLLEPLFPKSMTSFACAIIAVVGIQQLFAKQTDQ
jgi:hypothetical protein